MGGKICQSAWKNYVEGVYILTLFGSKFYLIINGKCIKMKVIYIDGTIMIMNVWNDHRGEE